MMVCQISIFAASLINFFFNPYGLQVGDSIAYAFGDQQNFDLLSFTGHSLRNWPVVLINLVLSKSLLQIFVQSLFSAFSWSFLISQYYRSNLSRKKEFAIFTALLFMRMVDVRLHRMPFPSHSIMLLQRLQSLRKRVH